MAEKKYYTLKKYSTICEIPVSTLRSFCKLGMPHIRPGRKIWVNPTECEQWIEQKFRFSKQINPRFEAMLTKIVDHYNSTHVDDACTQNK